MSSAGRKNVWCDSIIDGIFNHLTYDRSARWLQRYTLDNEVVYRHITKADAKDMIRRFLQPANAQRRRKRAAKKKKKESELFDKSTTTKLPNRALSCPPSYPVFSKQVLKHDVHNTKSQQKKEKVDPLKEYDKDYNYENFNDIPKPPGQCDITFCKNFIEVKDSNRKKKRKEVVVPSVIDHPDRLVVDRPVVVDHQPVVEVVDRVVGFEH